MAEREETGRTPNRLIHESSPYLRQHAFNPVKWYPWGQEAFETARKKDLPIFLSIGYSTCHWCHVMARESFEDEATARILNESFVCIKVDREERPDVDSIYMNATRLLTGGGGWPLSVFLTPTLQPFFAGTYFPPRDMPGRPGFSRLLLALKETYESRRKDVDASAADMAEAVGRALWAQSRPGEMRRQTITDAVETLMQSRDTENGGFGTAPKFPPAFSLQLLLREHARTGDSAALECVTQTLDHMLRGGVFDQIGGGFHRYSTDERWLTPHFEKMLYDNALMAIVLTEVWQVTERKDFAVGARRTLDFILRDLTSPEGGFYSALDADSEGEEGRFYVWTPAEVRQTLGEEDAAAFCAAYGITDAGNFEDGRSIPNRLERDASDAPPEGPLPHLRESLREAREGRPHPGRDEKCITAWNGLTVQALAFAGRAFGAGVYTDAARRAAEFVLERVRKNGDLAHSRARGYVSELAFLDDYACLLNGLLELYQTDFQPRWLTVAEELADQCAALFWDEKDSGFFFSRQEHGTPIARGKNPTDGVTPSGNSAAAMALGRLSRLVDRPDLREKAEATVRAFAESANGTPLAYENLLLAQEFLLAEPREIVLAGAPSSPEWKALKSVISHTFLPDAVLAGVWQGLEETPLTQGKATGHAGAAAFVCSNYACQAPVHSPEELQSLLQQPPQMPRR